VSGDGSEGEFMRFDKGEALSMLGMIAEHMVLDLVRVHEPQFAVRALVNVKTIEHGSTTRRTRSAG
jgi:hypothetical protein